MKSITHNQLSNLLAAYDEALQMNSNDMTTVKQIEADITALGVEAILTGKKMLLKSQMERLASLVRNQPLQYEFEEPGDWESQYDDEGDVNSLKAKIRRTEFEIEKLNGNFEDPDTNNSVNNELREILAYNTSIQDSAVITIKTYEHSLKAQKMGKEYAIDLTSRTGGTIVLFQSDLKEMLQLLKNYKPQ